ncbi:histidinol-phosphatase HisJ family protein [Marinilabiliaceae bacterium JC017]|nr:histidinol-phosphatase HisJ family protein [Marinilabiliaceae bacterium JC017]
MRWTNYHGHCEYCDGKGRIEDYVIKAIELKMATIGISSHAPVPFETNWTMPEGNLPGYLQEVAFLKDKYKGEIEVLRSLEVDYIPDTISPKASFIDESSLDYVVGSIHFVDQFEDGQHWAIDGSFAEFEKGLNEIFKGDIKAVVKRYFELEREMIQHACPDIVGHMDKIKMHNKTKFLFDEKAQWYVDEVQKTLELIAEKGAVVEINTKAFKRNGLIFPGPEHFNTLKKLNIPITINSDCHHPDKLINGFEEVAEMLLEQGIDQLHEFHEGKWVPVAFEKEGIVI